MIIRPLDPTTDRAAVDAVFQAASDCISLERGEKPGPDLTQEFFTAAPPGCDPAAALRLGLFDQAHLIGVAETGFGFPAPDDAFLGLMVLVPSARGKGAGHRFLQHIEAEARRRGAKNLFLAVLDENPRGQAFWRRQGFTVRLTGRPVTLGAKSHLASRMGKAL